MEGYDTTLIGSFIGYPAFREKYGYYVDAKSGYQLTAPWQTGIGDIQAVGNMIGALLNGYFTARVRRLLSFSSIQFTRWYLKGILPFPNAEEPLTRRQYGHRIVMMASLLTMTGTVFITFFAPNVCSLPRS